jgi:PDZ domain-containing secreted protein/Zn-dependent protease/CBS domain-containing protein
MSPRENRTVRGGGMLEPTFTFMRVRGIQVGAHWTWALVFALVVWTLRSQLFPISYPGLSSTTYWLMAGAAALAFFGSVLAHELGHALVAVRRGATIDGITLWLFGGVARIRGPFGSADTELITAAAGPAVSLVLVALFAGLTRLVSAADGPETVRGVLDYLARINLLLLGFNLVPALPLDGGRVLRAWLWKRHGDMVSATVIAARAGRTFGIILIGVGLLGFFWGADTGGLWIAFIGWFLLQAAQSEATQATVQHAFAGLRVRDAMTPDPEVLSPNTTVSGLVSRAATPGNPSSYPVVERGRLTGFASFRQAGAIPPDQRGRTRIRAVMTPAGEVVTLAPDDELAEAVQALQEGPGRAVVVDDDGHVLGLLTLGDVTRALEIRELRGDPIALPPPPGARRASFVVSAVVTLLLLVVGSLLYRPPFIVLSPGPTFDAAEGIKITGATVDDLNGTYELATVTIDQPTAFGMLVALIDPHKDVISEASLFPQGVNQDDYLRQQQQVFQESRKLAAAAAARAVGMAVKLKGTGAIVAATVPDTPAAGVLREGDVIVRINTRKIRLKEDVVAEVKSHPVGSLMRITVEREGRRQTVTLHTTRLASAPEAGVIIGAQLGTRDFDVVLPFDITFPQSDIGGPSAGLAYALAIADLLDPGDFAHGRRIAATGTIDVDGQVGAVGGVEQKLAGVEASGADVFLVPAGEETGLHGDDLTIRAVRDLREAITALRVLA